MKHKIKEEKKNRQREQYELSSEFESRGQKKIYFFRLPTMSSGAIYESAAMDSGSLSTALQSMDAGVGSVGSAGSGNMEDAMQNFIKNHVLSNPITCESTKTK